MFKQRILCRCAARTTVGARCRKYVAVWVVSAREVEGVRYYCHHHEPQA